MTLLLRTEGGVCGSSSALAPGRIPPGAHRSCENLINVCTMSTPLLPAVKEVPPESKLSVWLTSRPSRLCIMQPGLTQAKPDSPAAIWGREGRTALTILVTSMCPGRYALNDLFPAPQVLYPPGWCSEYCMFTLQIRPLTRRHIQKRVRDARPGLETSRFSIQTFSDGKQVLFQFLPPLGESWKWREGEEQELEKK